MVNKNGKMTLDKLAQMVASGFESVEKRFESIEQRMATKEDLHRLEQKVSRLDLRVEEVHDIVTGLETGSIFNLQKRVKVLEKSVRSISR